MSGKPEKRRGDVAPTGALAFGAPATDADGAPQKALVGHIVALPGGRGKLLVDVGSPLANLPCLGRPLSGPIHCDNGRD